MEPYSQIVSQIIKDQEDIIGPIALEQAKKINGLTITSLDNITISGDAKDVLSNLVDQYSKLFGKASIEVCKEAMRDSKSTLKPEEVPEILR